MATPKSKSHVNVNYNKKCQCTDRSGTYMVNYDMAMHEGDVLCSDCKLFVRFYDAG